MYRAETRGHRSLALLDLKISNLESNRIAFVQCVRYVNWQSGLFEL